MPLGAGMTWDDALESDVASVVIEFLNGAVSLRDAIRSLEALGLPEDEARDELNNATIKVA